MRLWSRLLIALPCVLLLALSLAYRERALDGDGTLRVTFFDVGQGDAALLVTPSGKQVVIDGGPNLSLLQHLGEAMPFFDRTIDLLVLSHPNLDHLAAFPAVLDRYRVRAVLITGVAYRMGAYQAFLSRLPAEKSQVILADPARDIDLGDGVTLDVVWPPPGLLGHTVKNENDTSIVLRAVFGTGAILFTGDMEAAAEKAVLAARADVRASVLKVAHHGSKTSSSTGFLLAVRPSLAVISVSGTNSYGHPHPSILRRFAALGIPVRTTAGEGNITIRLSR